MVRTIGPIYVNEEEHDNLVKAKGQRNWHDFIITLISNTKATKKEATKNDNHTNLRNKEPPTTSGGITATDYKR